MYNLAGLSVASVELSSFCNKVPGCFMCGRRKLEKEHPELCQWGNMDIGLVDLIAKQLPSNIIVSLHGNGDPLCYPRLKEALHRFKRQIRVFNTNAVALLEKADIIINNLESLTISVIENDTLGDKQYEDVKKFLEIKGNKKPIMTYRLLGNVENAKRWYELPGKVATRILHNPLGSFDYTKKVTLPEHQICMDMLTHCFIDRYGDFYPCIRYNPYKINKLGNIKENTLEELWNSPKRLNLLKEHVKGNRNCSKLCSKCDFYGIPRGD
jgi:radical SAM protein with 4Fe4S-binding SPASM domain